MTYTCLTMFFILLTWQHTSWMLGCSFFSRNTVCQRDRAQAAVTFVRERAALVSYNVSQINGIGGH